MKFEMKPLPYAKNALAPHLSEESFGFHYEKHHQAYLTNLQKLLDGTPEAEKSLEDIVKSSSGKVFNNAAQVWNHDFFWASMKPNSSRTRRSRSSARAGRGS
jgi:superoxide dismutase, Fe-Mn family